MIRTKVLQAVPVGKAIVAIVIRCAFSIIVVIGLSVAVVGYFVGHMGTIERRIGGVTARVLFFRLF
jgi:hypothetical protein